MLKQPAVVAMPMESCVFGLFPDERHERLIGPTYEFMMAHFDFKPPPRGEPAAPDSASAL
jgi:hypothetical protein